MKILWILSVILFCGCQDNRLEQVLRLAGDNRKELEKVLQHYSVHEKDSLKWKAACFLIENMPGHYTKEGAILDNCRKLPVSFYDKKMIDICIGVYLPDSLERTEDVKVITSDYLIRHIDASFELLRYPWLKNIPFEWFLDFVLPYRLEYEQPDSWRDSVQQQFYPEEKQLVQDHKFDASQVALAWDIPPINQVVTKYAYRYLGRNLAADCHRLFLENEFSGRAGGLPVALDFIPCYPNRNGLHYWTTVLSAVRKSSYISGAPQSIAAKVYRRTYSLHLFLSPGPDEYIPPFFRDPFHQDVTDQYFYTSDVTVEIAAEIPAALRYSYLAVFNNLDWAPVAIGERKGKKALLGIQAGIYFICRCSTSTKKCVP